MSEQSAGPDLAHDCISQAASKLTLRYYGAPSLTQHEFIDKAIRQALRDSPELARVREAIEFVVNDGDFESVEESVRCCAQLHRALRALDALTGGPTEPKP